MSLPGDMQSEETLPPEFFDQVKLALEHLYDFSFLQRHPLAAVHAASGTTVESPGLQLRRDLLSAIETLSPGPGVPFRAPHARIYQLIHLHYVEGLSVQETAHELGLSSRQAYRDLRRGEESVAALLWNQYGSPPGPVGSVREASSLEAEMERLELQPEQIDLQSLLAHVQTAVTHLARQRQVDILLEAPKETVMIYSDPSVAQQVLISIMSGTIQQANPGDLCAAIEESTQGVRITISYSCAESRLAEPAARDTTVQISRRLGWTIAQTDAAQNRRQLAVQLESPSSVVLVIDDNEGLVDLIRRYVSSPTCRVVAATSGEKGLQMAQEIHLRAIVLDVMMPKMDGWEVLQVLQSHPDTASVPVIICSMFNDPELAYSLGAAWFLPKPVRRDDIRGALRELGVV